MKGRFRVRIWHQHVVQLSSLERNHPRKVEGGLRQPQRLLHQLGLPIRPHRRRPRSFPLVHSM